MSSKVDIKNLAQLSRLRLKEEEESRLEKHLEQIIGYIDQLNELDTSKVEPTSHTLPIHNIFREDNVCKPISKDYLTNSPACKKGHYEVPKII